VIPRDFHLDPVREFPGHVDSCGSAKAPTIRVSFPLHVMNGEPRPGVKRGGTVNIVTTPRSECSCRQHSASTSTPMSARGKQPLAASVRHQAAGRRESLSREDATLVTIVPPSGYAEEMKAAAAAAAAGPALFAAPGAAPAAVRRLPRLRRVLPSAAGAKAPAGGGDKKSRRAYRQSVTVWRQDHALFKNGARSGANRLPLLLIGAIARDARHGLFSASVTRLETREQPATISFFGRR